MAEVLPAHGLEDDSMPRELEGHGFSRELAVSALESKEDLLTPALAGLDDTDLDLIHKFTDSPLFHAPAAIATSVPPSAGKDSSISHSPANLPEESSGGHNPFSNKGPWTVESHLLGDLAAAKPLPSPEVSPERMRRRSSYGSQGLGATPSYSRSTSYSQPEPSAAHDWAMYHAESMELARSGPALWPAAPKEVPDSKAMSRLMFRLEFLRHCSQCMSPKCHLYGPFCEKGRRACKHAMDCDVPSCTNVACQTLDLFKRVLLAEEDDSADSTVGLTQQDHSHLRSATTLPACPSDAFSGPMPLQRLTRSAEDGSICSSSSPAHYRARPASCHGSLPLGLSREALRVGVRQLPHPAPRSARPAQYYQPELDELQHQFEIDEHATPSSLFALQEGVLSRQGSLPMRHSQPKRARGVDDERMPTEVAWQAPMYRRCRSLDSTVGPTVQQHLAAATDVEDEWGMPNKRRASGSWPAPDQVLEELADPETPFTAAVNQSFGWEGRAHSLDFNLPQPRQLLQRQVRRMQVTPGVGEICRVAPQSFAGASPSATRSSRRSSSDNIAVEGSPVC